MEQLDRVRAWYMMEKTARRQITKLKIRAIEESRTLNSQRCFERKEEKEFNRGVIQRQRQTDKWTGRQTDRQTNGQADRQTNGLADRQTNWTGIQTDSARYEQRFVKPAPAA
jgi:hypothetical protein